MSTKGDHCQNTSKYGIMIVVKSLRFPGVLLLALTLTACFGLGKKEVSVPVLAANRGMQWAYELMLTGRVAPPQLPRPSAMLGPYVAAFLSLPVVDTSHAAVSGVLSGVAFFIDEGGNRDESYALLEELGLALQVDLPNLLNRGVDRRGTLDIYRTGLIDVATRSQEHLGLLESRLDEADEEVRAIRKQTAEVQRALNDALRAKDYATAGSRQSELSVVQGELAIVTSKQKELRSILNLFEDSLDVAAERLAAIDANREALVAGVTVTDIPGADDLGVLRDSERSQRNTKPEDVFGGTQPTQ